MNLRWILTAVLVAAAPLHAQTVEPDSLAKHTHPAQLTHTTWIMTTADHMMLLTLAEDGSGYMATAFVDTDLSGKRQVGRLDKGGPLTWWVEHGNVLCIIGNKEDSGTRCYTARVTSKQLWLGEADLQRSDYFPPPKE